MEDMKHELKQRAESLLLFDLDESKHAIAIFDTDLNYIYANKSVSKLLSKSREELEGRNLMKIFPELTASASHRHILTAISGVRVEDVISEGHITKYGAKFSTSYYPLRNETGIFAIISVVKTLYMPK
ncbi:MAG: PAS domain-containing protein [Bacteroidia bacterium]|jgi:PAS domain S-box-containing protein